MEFQGICLNRHPLVKSIIVDSWRNRVALDAARERGLQLVVRTLDDALPGTVVSTHTNQQQA
jgi:hypothetical protein